MSNRPKRVVIPEFPTRQDVLRVAFGSGIAIGLSGILLLCIDELVFTGSLSARYIAAPTVVAGTLLVAVSTIIETAGMWYRRAHDQVAADGGER